METETNMPAVETESNTLAQELLYTFGRFRRLHGQQSPVAGLTRSEFMALACIRRGGMPEESGVRVSEISNLLQLAPPTITQQIQELETRGLVEKHSDPDDRRAVRVRLTTKGDQAVQTAWSAMLASFNGLVIYLGEEDSLVLVKLMDKVATYFQEVREANP